MNKRQLWKILLAGVGLLLLATVTTQATASPPGIVIPGSWTKYASNPVFLPGTTGAWDDAQVMDPCVIFNGSTYEMWYTGATVVADIWFEKIGYATSPDGVTWTRNPTPVLTEGAAGSWDLDSVRSPSVLYHNGTYQMWYVGFGSAGTGRIGYATSTNGIDWVKYGSSPVLDLGSTGAWDSIFVGDPTVIHSGSYFYMWYLGKVGGHYAIGGARSTDGIVWGKFPGNPMLVQGSSDSWEAAVYGPTVFFDGTRYHMWYAGGNYDLNTWQTGYAFSTDGNTWYKQGMVLQQGPENYDAKSADYPSVMLEGSTLKMWYSTINDTETQGAIAYATAPVTILDHFIYLPTTLR